MFLTVVSFVVVLGILVFIHELGHYLVAKRNGIVVEEFGMGYPPRLVKLFRYDGTDFTLNLIPFGGFARMKGEDMGDMSPGSFNGASRMARAATLVAGPAMNALLAILLFAASFMAGFPALVGHPQILSVAPGSAAAAAGLEVNDVVLLADGKTSLVGALSQLDYDVIQEPVSVAETGTLRVLRAGEIVELQLPPGVTGDALMAEFDYVPVLSIKVTGVAEGSPAAAAGLQPDDLFYAVNDITISEHNSLNDVVQAHVGQEVTLTLVRDGEVVTTKLTPRANPPQGEGSMGVAIGPSSTLATMPWYEALWEGVRSTGEYVTIVLQLPVMLLAGQMSADEAQLSGPVGIAQLVGGAVNATLDTGLWFPILRLSAVLSAALAITNMLPLPALDGGRLLFILVEAIRGRRVNPEREGLIHMVGFMVLLGLLLLVTVRDITAGQQSIDWMSILGQ